MPNQIESLRIGDRAGMPGKTLILGMALAIGVGALATFWTYLQVAYHYGVLARCQGVVGRFGWESFNPLQSWLQHPERTGYQCGHIYVWWVRVCIPPPVLKDAPIVVDAPSIGLRTFRGIVGWTYLFLVSGDGELAP